MNFDPNTGQPINNNVQPTPQAAPSKTNGMAIAGFIVSLLVSGLIGLILSIIGLNKAKECNSGKGLAIAGIIIGIVKMILTILVVVLWSSLFVGLFGVLGNYAEACSNAYACGPADSSGMASCKYKKEGSSVEYTVSCPVNTPTTKAVTTKKADTDTSVAQEFKLDTDSEFDYYADKFYLKNNKVYAHLTTNAPSSYKNDEKINGEDVKLIIDTKVVKKVFVVESGQAGYQTTFAVDNKGVAWEILNNDAKGQELYIREMVGSTNVDKIYSLAGNGAWDYIFVNTSNQILARKIGKYNYVYIDKENGIYENKIGNDVIKLNYVKSETDSAKEVKHNYFEVTVNGTKQTDLVDYVTNEDYMSYDDVDLVELPYCVSGSTYKFGSACN